VVLIIFLTIMLDVAPPAVLGSSDGLDGFTEAVQRSVSPPLVYLVRELPVSNRDSSRQITADHLLKRIQKPVRLPMTELTALRRLRH
jgi:hypothetical protein